MLLYTSRDVAFVRVGDSAAAILAAADAAAIPAAADAAAAGLTISILIR